MTDQDKVQKLWPIPMAVIFAIACFAATFFQIAEGVRQKEPRGLTPIFVGSAVFAASMFFFAEAMIAQKGKRRVKVSVAIVAAETLIFAYAQLFLMQNIFGS